MRPASETPSVTTSSCSVNGSRLPVLGPAAPDRRAPIAARRVERTDRTLRVSHVGSGLRARARSPAMSWPSRCDATSCTTTSVRRTSCLARSIDSSLAAGHPARRSELAGSRHRIIAGAGVDARISKPNHNAAPSRARIASTVTMGCFHHGFARRGRRRARRCVDASEATWTGGCRRGGGRLARDRSAAPPSRDDHDATLPPPYSRSTAMSLAVPTGGAFQSRSTVVSRLAARSAWNGSVCGLSPATRTCPLTSAPCTPKLRRTTASWWREPWSTRCTSAIAICAVGVPRTAIDTGNVWLRGARDGAAVGRRHRALDRRADVRERGGGLRVVRHRDRHGHGRRGVRIELDRVVAEREPRRGGGSEIAGGVGRGELDREAQVRGVVRHDEVVFFGRARDRA